MGDQNLDADKIVILGVIRQGRLANRPYAPNPLPPGYLQERIPAEKPEYNGRKGENINFCS
jgi:hypothetical protein